MPSKNLNNRENGGVMCNLCENKLFQVSGRVTDSETGQVIVGLLVKAVGRETEGEKTLGNAYTDDQGHYLITFTSDQIGKTEKVPYSLTAASSFCRVISEAELGLRSLWRNFCKQCGQSKAGPNLMVRAFDQDGLELAESGVIYDAPAETTIDLVVYRRPAPLVSEYEMLVARSTPHLNHIPIAELEADDIERLSSETGLPKSMIEALVQCARLARETGLPTEFFYALARQASVISGSTPGQRYQRIARCWCPRHRAKHRPHTTGRPNGENHGLV